MRVVVTGGAGKVGSAVLRDLATHRPGWEVRVLDRVRPATAPEHDFVDGSVTDPGAVRAALWDANAVIHLAAVPRPGAAPDDVILTTNVLGTFHVYKTAADCGVERVVLASSTAVLGTDWGRRDRLPVRLPIDEQHPLMPEDAYGLSKVCAESVAAGCVRRTGVESVVLRPGWVVDDADLKELSRSAGVRVQGFHHYAYVHVEDLAAAFRLAVERAGIADEVLFAVADDSTLDRPLAEALAPLHPDAARTYRTLTGLRPAISNARAKERLHWTPRRSWRDGT